MAKITSRRSKALVKEFRKRLVHIRKLRRLNQTELAERAGMMSAAISQFENGTRAPNFESLIKLADALNITVDYLIGRDHEILSVGPMIDKLTRLAEQLPATELDYLISLADIFAQRNKENRMEAKDGYESNG